MNLLEKTITAITPVDHVVRAAAKERLDQLTMPPWALGRLMDLALDLAGITGSLAPAFSRKAVIVMAGDHGVVAEGISKFPAEVTHQMVANFVHGGAGINAIARQVGARVIVVDMGVRADLEALVAAGKIISKKIGAGTANMARGPAMTRKEAIGAIAGGIEVLQLVASEIDVVGTGDMGIGNTTPSAAIASVLTGHSVATVTGRGTGLDDSGLAHKIRVIEQSIATNQPDGKDGIDILAKVGGYEIGGIAGVILGAAAAKKPVVIDGFISTAGALIAHSLCPAIADYIIAAHRSVEPGHSLMLRHLGCDPYLDLNLRLGEGTGAALAMNLVEAAARILTEVATFSEAAVATAM